MVVSEWYGGYGPLYHFLSAFLRGTNSTLQRIADHYKLSEEDRKPIGLPRRTLRDICETARLSGKEFLEAHNIADQGGLPDPSPDSGWSTFLSNSTNLKYYSGVDKTGGFISGFKDPPVPSPHITGVVHGDGDEQPLTFELWSDAASGATASYAPYLEKKADGECFCHLCKKKTRGHLSGKGHKDLGNSKTLRRNP